MSMDPRELLSRVGLRSPLSIAIAGVAVVAVVVVAVVVLAGGGGGDGGGDDSDTFHAGLASGVPTPEATLALQQAPPPSEACRKEANLSSLADADRLMIPKINVSAPLSHKVVGSDGQMPDPSNPDEVAYYDFSRWDCLGGGPGRGGNSVFSGHVDSGFKPCKNGTVKPPCTAVFWDLRDLKTGDTIEVKVGADTFRYAVVGNESVDANNAAWDKIVSWTPKESLTIITCGGDFNHGEYNRRQVVKAERV
jgi:LPXTG-site transpeptidase (sortase) family protein